MACQSCLEARRKALLRMGKVGARLGKKLLPADMQIETAPKPAPRPAPIVAPERAATVQKIPAQRLIDEARALVGTRYLHQGRNAAGVDCIGFAALAAARAGLDLNALYGDAWRVADYPPSASPDLLRIIETVGERIATPVPGCGILFKWPGPAHPQHMAIYTEHATIIHALMRRRQVVEHGYREKWLDITHSVWLLPGIDYT